MPDSKQVSQQPAVLSTPAPLRSVPNRAAIGRQAQQAVEIVHQRLTLVEAQVKNRANAFLAQAQSSQIQQLAKNSPELSQQLPTLIDSLKKASSAVDASQSGRSQTLSGIRAKLQLFTQGKS